MSKNPENQNITIYQSNDGKISFNVNVFEETVWLTQKQMAELFGVQTPAINKHLKNIFNDKELVGNSVISILETTAPDGKMYNTKFYNLDAIISVGYRVNSSRATQFRIWATNILKSYMTNGYAINETKVKALLEEYISKLKLEFKDDIQKVYEKLAEFGNKPINIYNQISLTSNKLEDKIIDLLDELITKIKTDKNLKNQLEEIKTNLQTSPKDKKTKNKITEFFRELGDGNSNLNKTIKGVGISKKIITELVKLGEKLKDLVF